MDKGLNSWLSLDQAGYKMWGHFFKTHFLVLQPCQKVFINFVSFLKFRFAVLFVLSGQFIQILFLILNLLFSCKKNNCKHVIAVAVNRDKLGQHANKILWEDCQVRNHTRAKLAVQNSIKNTKSFS